MQFNYGDRVLMLKHQDWKQDAAGKIISVRTRLAKLFDGSEDQWHWIEFDEPQQDTTDELNGRDLVYKSSTVLGRFLRPLGRTENDANDSQNSSQE